MAVFVDTNVLVYAHDASETEKQAQARAWLQELWRRRSGRLSYQVLQEFYVTVTAKLRPGLPPDEARASILDLLAWNPVSIDHEVFAAAWAMQDQHALSFWDALIAGAALTLRCEILLSEDLQHGMDLGGVRVIDPFKTQPSSIA